MGIAFTGMAPFPLSATPQQSRAVVLKATVRYLNKTSALFKIKPVLPYHACHHPPPCTMEASTAPTTTLARMTTLKKT
jgi:hypothetical protein